MNPAEGIREIKCMLKNPDLDLKIVNNLTLHLRKFLMYVMYVRCTYLI